MFVALRMLSLPEDRLTERDAIVAALSAAAPVLPTVRTCWIAPVSPVAVINAGHIVWRMTHATEGEALRLPESAAWRETIAPLIDGLSLTTIGYRITNSVARRTGPGIWRVLIFRTFPDADTTLVRKLGEMTLLLPEHIAEIRGWALSTVAYTDAPKAFTHVWEQEFAALCDLTGPYMTDPFHWGVVDAYFDAEYPEYIVDPQLIQIVGTIGESLLEPIGPQPEEPA